MTNRVQWLQTDKHVYGAIYREHYHELQVFGTCTAPEGNPMLGIALPYILTEWGFSRSDTPLIRSIATKDSMEQNEYDYKYYIACIKREKECDCG